MKVEPFHRSEIAAMRKRAYPNEACGIITSRGLLIPVKNVSDEPRRSFMFDPDLQVWLWNTYGDPAVIWHTHPDDPAVPSAGDIRFATEPEALYVIAGTDGVRSWEILDGRAREV